MQILVIKEDMTPPNYHKYQSNNKQIPRDRYDGLLFLSVVFATSLVGVSSCRAIKDERSELIKYRIHQDQIRTNYGVGR